MAAKDTPVVECHSCRTEGRFPIVQVPYDAVYGFNAQIPLCPYCYAMSLANAVLSVLKPHEMFDVARAQYEMFPKHPFPIKQTIERGDPDLFLCSCECAVCANCEGGHSNV